MVRLKELGIARKVQQPERLEQQEQSLDFHPEMIRNQTK